MKCLFLDSVRPGRGAVFATGTPVSNTICEVYVMLRYLAPALLERAGIHHFDAWAATFTRRVTALELSRTLQTGMLPAARALTRFCR